MLCNVSQFAHTTVTFSSQCSFHKLVVMCRGTLKVFHRTTIHFFLYQMLVHFDTKKTKLRKVVFWQKERQIQF